MENRVTFTGIPADVTEAEVTAVVERGFSKLKRFKWLPTEPLDVGSVTDDARAVLRVDVPARLALVGGEWLHVDDVRVAGGRRAHLAAEGDAVRAAVLEYHLENAAERAVDHFRASAAAPLWGAYPSSRAEADELLEGADPWLRPNMVERYDVGTPAQPLSVPLRLTFQAGTGGGKAWDAAVHFARWIFRNPHEFEGKRVVELGCGLGLPSMVALRFARQVVLSDFVTELLDNLEYNVRQNSELTDDPEGYRRRAEVLRLDWKAFRAGDVPAADLVIFSDVVYNQDVAQLLPRVIRGALRSGGHVLAVMPDARAGLHDFFAEMRAQGFQHEKLVMPSDCVAGDRAALASRLHRWVG